MFIDEIPLWSKVTVCHRDVTLETHVKFIQVGKSTHYCMLEPIKIKETVVSFPIDGTTLEWEHPEGGIFKFKPDRISNIRYSEQDYLVFICDKDTKMFNRRKEYRSEFTVEAEVQLGNNTQIYDCYVHDVSRSGMSFKIRLDKKPKANVGMKMSLSFRHEKYDRIYKVDGHIRRIIDMEPFVFMGVELEEPSTSWLALVNTVERQSLRLRKEAAADNKKK